MEMIFDWVDADRGCVMLKDLETGRLVPKVRRHRRGVRGDERISISKTILDFVVDHNEGVLTSDAKDDDRFDAAQSKALESRQKSHRDLPDLGCRTDEFHMAGRFFQRLQLLFVTTCEFVRHSSMCDPQSRQLQLHELTRGIIVPTNP